MKKEFQGKKRRPTVKDMITRPFYYKPVISPDGKKVAYTKITLDLSKNSMFGKFYIYDVESQKTHYVFADGSDVQWIDNETFAVNRHSPSGTPRWSDVYLVTTSMGEGVRILGNESRVGYYSLYANGLVFLSNKSVEKSRVGDFVHVERETPQTALYYVSTDRVIQNEELDRLYFEEEKYSRPLSKFEITSGLDSKYQISSIVVSAATKTIYLNCQIGSDLYYEYDTVCIKVEIDPDTILDAAEESSLEDALSSLSYQELSLPKGYTVKAVSPDGTVLLISGPVPGASVQPRDDLWLISDTEACAPKDDENPMANLKLISENLDRKPVDIHWTKKGIYVSHWEESMIVITRLLESGEFETYNLGMVSPKSQFSINDNGDIAFAGVSPTAMQEVYYGSLEKGVERITRTTEDYAHLDLGTVESIRWTSKDGTEIEGLLRKPSDFDSSRKYPLVIYPHGGPRASSFLSLVANEFAHPVHSLIGKDMLILEPNYRGGLGRGREFSKLNHNNLGVGDVWDLESGIDYLIDQGFVDPTKIASMGGSQGGYLSAY
ncbi:MAG: prolyl oligopeptidase family serine peptidase, partial [Candidatus Thorarchaeota archaeon]|nr:prolyl oligopeptidase family serine peptidase [Candidatus Thorarchaeota archaeon]